MLKPSWAKNYEVKMTPEVGTLYTDLSYGEKESNRFDMYLPHDQTKKHYGLVVYLHAGGFTSGDKSGDKDILSWLVPKDMLLLGLIIHF